MPKSEAERRRTYKAKIKAEGGERWKKEKTYKKASENRRRRNKTANRPFVAIDGEAFGEAGYHLLASSRDAGIFNPSGLSSADCLRYLLSLGGQKDRPILVGFSLTYDCEWWIKDFTKEQLEGIRKHRRCDIKLDGWTYTVDYVPRKWFKIGFVSKKTDTFIPKVEIYDLFTFFQQSFLKVVAQPKHDKDGWNCCTDEEWKLLQWGKKSRGEFRLEDAEALAAYNQVECACLVRVANRLREALHTAGIKLRSWHGPGAVAGYLLRAHGMQEHIGELPVEVANAARRVYFGGRFEVCQLGVHEQCYDYDISSAYPKATTLLPSTQGHWQRVEEYQGDDAKWTMYHVEWNVERKSKRNDALRPLVPFPWRDKNGGVQYAPRGRGWYWAYEVTPALVAWGPSAIRIIEGFRLYPQEEGVFEWMTELAQKRVEAKQAAKDATGEERDRLNALQRVYKLALNSVYGKTIQTAGMKQREEGKKRYRTFLCPIWASLITSWCRGTLLRAALLDPEAIICMATDGLFTTRPLEALKTGDELGDWELAEQGELQIYKSGMYVFYLPNGRMKACKMRGISAKQVPWSEVKEKWIENGPNQYIDLIARRFVGHRAALARNDLALHCQWIDVPKREWLHPGYGWRPGMGGPYTTMRWECNNREKVADSHPYKKLSWWDGDAVDPDDEPENWLDVIEQEDLAH